MNERKSGKVTAFDVWTRRRFGAAAGLAAIATFELGWGIDAKRKRGKKPKPDTRNRCTRTGEACRKAGRNCKPKYCLKAPFTVSVELTVIKNHEMFLFVPPENETTGPAPFIQSTCSPTSPCATQYPRACIYVDRSTTFHGLLSGDYEYWINLAANTPAGEVQVTLRDRGGRIVRQWKNPLGDPMYERGWHVFDLNGRTGAIVSIDERSTGALPGTAYDPYTDVCP